MMIMRVNSKSTAQSSHNHSSFKYDQQRMIHTEVIKFAQTGQQPLLNVTNLMSITVSVTSICTKGLTSLVKERIDILPNTK